MSYITERSLVYGPHLRAVDSSLNPRQLREAANARAEADYEPGSWPRTREQCIADAAYLRSLADRQTK